MALSIYSRCKALAAELGYQFKTSRIADGQGGRKVYIITDSDGMEQTLSPGRCLDYLECVRVTGDTIDNRATVVDWHWRGTCY